MKNFWPVFVDLLRESVLVQSAATLLLLTVVCVLVLQGRQVPDVISLALGTVMGYWFKSKQSLETAKNTAAIAEAIRSKPEIC